jgi:hypothetical protein
MLEKEKYVEKNRPYIDLDTRRDACARILLEE